MTRRKKKKTLANFISGLLLILIMLLVFNRVWIYHQIKRVVGFGSLQLYVTETVELPYDIDRGMVPEVGLVDGMPLTILDSTMTLYSQEGEPRWQETMDFESVATGGNSNFFVVADIGKGNVMAYDYRGNVNASLFGEGEIAGIRVSPAGYVFLQNAVNTSIEVYDPQLNQVSTLSRHAGDVLDIKFGVEDGLVYVGTFEVNDGKLASYLYKYDVDGNLIGSIQMQDQLLLEYELDGTTLVLVTDQNLATYQTDMTAIDSINAIGDIDLVAYNEGVLFIQTFDRQSELSDSASEYDLIGYDLSKKEIVFNQPLGKPYDEMTVQGKYLVCYNNNEIELRDLSGDPIQTFDLPREVTAIECIEDSRLLLEGTDYFMVVELRH